MLLAASVKRMVDNLADYRTKSHPEYRWGVGQLSGEECAFRTESLLQDVSWLQTFRHSYLLTK